MFKKAFTDTLPVMAGYLVLGIGFGIIMTTSGYSIVWSLIMSLFIYAGSMQYAGIGLLTGGASLITVALTTLMVNARHLFYGISMVDKYKNVGKMKPYLIFGLTDETYALVVRDFWGKVDFNSSNSIVTEGGKSVNSDSGRAIVDEIHKSVVVNEGVVANDSVVNNNDVVNIDSAVNIISLRDKYFFFVTALDHIYWVVGSVIGALLGTIITFDTTGIDFALTALFITIFTDQWLKTKNHLPAIIGVIASVCSLIFFGKQSFLIPSMIIISVALLIMKRFENTSKNMIWMN